MKIRTTAILLCLFACFSCNKSEDESSTTMEYLETKCADSWDYGQNNTNLEVISAIETYFDEELQIDVSNINIVQVDGEVEFCEACNCRTGRVISLDVNEAFTDELIGEGFYIP